jgi:hydroxymethylpyrimidine/phosphomethylpyrimidine kinase
MRHSLRSLNTVLAIGGHDPGGGAGIQADIESIVANGCHAATAVTALTVQDSCNLTELHPVAPARLIDQIEAIFGDCRVAAVKIGLIGDPSLAKSLVELLKTHRNIPLVFDPVLATGGGDDLTSQELLEILRIELLPLCSLITPNSLEARRLCGGAELSLDDCAQELIEFGARSVLITGAHEMTSRVCNRLYDKHGLLDASEWERLPGEYHGSGCTLAAAIAAALAQGAPLIEAVRQGQRFSWRSLEQGIQVGRCQFLPDRLYRLGRKGQ